MQSTFSSRSWEEHHETWKEHRYEWIIIIIIVIIIIIITILVLSSSSSSLLLLLLLLLLGTSGSPPGKTFPSTCTRRSPHLTSPNLRSVNKSGDDHSPSGNGNVLSKSAMGQALGVWFCACKCPYGGGGKACLPHHGFPEVEARATLAPTS